MTEPLPMILVDYVRAKLEDDIDAMLDDPHGYHGADTAEVIVAHNQRLADIAQLIDLNLRQMLVDRGNPVELKRLMDFLTEARQKAK